MTVKQMTKDFFVDLNPSVTFAPWGHLKGICTGSRLYSYSFARQLDAREHLSILGYDISKLRLDMLEDWQLRDLAGNAHSLVQVGIVVASILLGAHFPGLWEF